ncbi:hypothetical protein [Corynebacterium pygosceleis]|uniref:hypothetical protein n=1 Tax=Corynebacterium pygosceleis TaxID=2800406 RepID=UPI002003AC4C|nr:hypothetical protein [Corynebacterium pygosceleis]MCK7676412.1 hypothetical protein [Corynebacterium pygosceleis]
MTDVLTPGYWTRQKIEAIHNTAHHTTWTLYQMPANTRAALESDDLVTGDPPQLTPRGHAAAEYLRRVDR